MAIFVIKEHWARSHHFDFRLEKDGVFKSWAVPKGLPESPGLKRLAVQVEDHALEFGPFHEANLEGESTKGRIQVWDHGTYEIEQWTDDRIAFTLHGSRVSGTFSLFRFKESEPLSWFLIKRRQDAADLAAIALTQRTARCTSSSRLAMLFLGSPPN